MIKVDLVIVLIVGVTTACVIFILGIAIGSNSGWKGMERKAITDGVAVWEEDQKGNPKFTWKKDINE